jgi:hydroxypyruvate reductase
MAGIARSTATHGQPLSPPALLLSGGETTVTVAPGAATGRGGRNTEFLLAFALAANALPRCWALAADTDGIDGNAAAAGALTGPDTLARARTAGLAPQAVLDRHDSATLFDALGDLVLTGPTRTNVNDFRAILLA